MASTDAIPVPRKNAAYRFYFAIRKPSDSTLITTWTGMDSEVSLDGAAFSDCTNESTEIGTSGCGYIDLTAAEMNADSVILKVTVTNTGAVPLVFTFLPESAGDYRVADTQKVDVETIKTNPVVNNGTITFPTTATLASTTNITAATGVVLSAVTHTGAVIPAVTTVTTTTNLTTNNDKTGYSLTATTGLGNQTANITGTITAVTTATNVTTVNGLAAGVITAASIATGAIDADSLATDAVAEIADGVWDEALAGHAGAGSAGLALSTASSGGVDPSVLADAIWDEALSGHATAGTAGKAVSDILVDTAEIGTAGAGLTALATQVSVNDIPTNAELTAALGAGTWASAIPWNAAWDAEVQSEAADAITAASLATAANVSAVLTTQLTESYAADGVAPTLAQAIFLIQQALTEFTISGTTTTVKKLDGTTTAATLTLNDGTTPTGVTRAT